MSEAQVPDIYISPTGSFTASQTLLDCTITSPCSLSFALTALQDLTTPEVTLTVKALPGHYALGTTPSVFLKIPLAIQSTNGTDSTIFDYQFNRTSMSFLRTLELRELTLQNIRGTLIASQHAAFLVFQDCKFIHGVTSSPTDSIISATASPTKLVRCHIENFTGAASLFSNTGEPLQTIINTTFVNNTLGLVNSKEVQMSGCYFADNALPGQRNLISAKLLDLRGTTFFNNTLVAGYVITGSNPTTMEIHGVAIRNTTAKAIIATTGQLPGDGQISISNTIITGTTGTKN